MCRSTKRPGEGIKCPKAVVTGACELDGVGAGIPIWVLLLEQQGLVTNPYPPSYPDPVVTFKNEALNN